MNGQIIYEICGINLLMAALIIFSFCVLEECLPYYRVRFSDGVELIADDSELFSLDPRFGELISAVSGAFSCARSLNFAGPWALVAEGSDDEKSEFLRAFADYSITLPAYHWKRNHNTPARFRTE